MAMPMVAGAFLFATLPACSRTPKEPKVAEIPITAGQPVDAPEGELYQSAKQLYYAGLYSVAKDSFQSIKENFPLGPYAEFAEIKLADCEFETRQFDAAAQLYEEFLKTRPSSRAVPYVSLKAGRSFQLSNRGVGRDNASLEKALDYFNKVIADYPSSIYVVPAGEYRQEVLQSLAAYEQMVQDFYKKQDKPDAYEARKKAYEQKWQPLIDGEAKPVQVAKASGESPEEPQLRPADEGAVPQQPERSDGERPAQGEKTVAASKASGDTQPHGDRDWQIQNIDCQPSAHRLFVYLSKNITDYSGRSGSGGEFYFPSREVSPARDSSPGEGGVVVKLPSASAEPEKRDCFGTKDLEVSADGELRLSGVNEASVFSLNNPPRLVVEAR